MPEAAAFSADTTQAASGGSKAPASNEFWERLRLPHFEHDHPPVANANTVYQNGLSPLDRLAVAITDRVGSMGFFLAILAWTILWTGYNILASEVPALHWKSFDPFPAFVAYLLISNVIQILLMPLIMVGQNVQGKHTEIRAELDFQVNQKAEKEIMVVLRNLEHNTDLMLQLMRHLECRVSEEELRALAAEHEIAAKLETAQSTADAK
jgi:uncharacterized membrane protein